MKFVVQNNIRKVSKIVSFFNLSKATKYTGLALQVTKLCMVSGGDVSVDRGTLTPELRHWQGLLVVGTAHGTLHLLDLALDLGCEYM